MDCTATERSRTLLLPSLPAAVPRAALVYPRSLVTAPYTALMGVVVDGRQPLRVKETARDRVRRQVGSTNRWRLPEALGSDLLGTAQAIKSTSCSYPQPQTRVLPADKKEHLRTKEVGYSDSVSLLKGAAPTKSWTAPPRTKASTTCPRTMREEDVFLYHSKKSETHAGPDVLLQCLDLNWELHRPYLQKSRTLSELFKSSNQQAGPQQYYKGHLEPAMLDDFVKEGGIYDNQTELGTSGQATKVETPKGGIFHPKHSGSSRVNNMTVLQLNINDPRVSKRALAIALGHLYHDKVDVHVYDVAGVLGAAHALRFQALIDACCQVMTSNISASTVCEYHAAASDYNLGNLKTSCEDWLLLNLVTEMSYHVELRSVSQPLLQTLLQSNRLFTTSEYALYKTICTWIYLQLNKDVQVMCSFTRLVAYFHSLPKISSLLDREQTQLFSPLLKQLRYHGITDCSHMYELQQMNIIPQSWLVQILNDHFRSLQAGGDMAISRNEGILSKAVRQGFILDKEPHYHSEIMALLGFHFELRAMKHKSDGEYHFYMQRLKPSDPILSFRQSELQMFSMRADREVTYNIRVQYYQDGHVVTESTGVLNKKFGLGESNSKSQVLVLSNLEGPVYVTFTVMFNPS